MPRRRACVRSLRRIGSPCRTGGATYYPLADVQGTIWGYADANNAIVASFTYDAWGNILSATSSVPALASNRYRFHCREWSAATGLVNFRARWYDPVTGRWLSKDPIGLSGGLNLYVFCGNDPVNSLDLFGLSEAENEQAGKKALTWAKNKIGSKNYNEWGTRGFPRWFGQPKCNLFVADAYNNGNGKTIIPTGTMGTHPPTANDWFIGNHVPVGFVDTNTPQPGDIVASRSHIGIVSDVENNSISASSIDNSVLQNDWGFRDGGESVRFWHYGR